MNSFFHFVPFYFFKAAKFKEFAGIKSTFIVSGSGKVHAHGGTIELIKLRVMSDESIARGRAMLCEIFGKGIKDKEKKHDL